MTFARVDKKNKIYASAALILTFVAIILRLVCLVGFYDGDIGYFEDAFLPKLLFVFSLIAALSFISSLFVSAPKSDVKCASEENVFTKVASVLAALAFGAFFAISVLSTSLVASVTVFDLLSKLISLLAVVYFAINLFSPSVNRCAQTLIGFAVILWGIYVIGVTYFDIYVQLNSPDKITVHLALLCAMHFLVNEFRCFVDSPKKRMYLASACLCVFFTGIEAIPSLINGFISGFEFYNYFAYDVVIFALFIYSLARLCTLAFSKEKELFGAKNTQNKTEAEQQLEIPDNKEETAETEE